MAFAALMEQGYRYARHARKVNWKDEAEYWIQWTLKEPGVADRWAYDPQADKAVEMLQVREK